MRQNPDTYDVICVGTGFATSFFLYEFLRRAGPETRILVLERGSRDSHQWQVQHRRHARRSSDSLFRNLTPAKPWMFTPAFGGGSNCWWGATPRMLPSDFELRTRYGIGVDWPLTYEDLAPFYAVAERVMSVSGPEGRTAYPGVASYPQPPHRLTDPDRLLQTAYPDQFFPTATARARTDTVGRPRCCASGVCSLCPIDAKFTIENALGSLYRDPRVTLLLETTALAVETNGSVARGLYYEQNGRDTMVPADLVVLGANAIFNAHLLHRSGLSDGVVGTGLNEQVSVQLTLDLDGVDNFQGSTSLTGHGYMFYDGPHRASRAGCLLETSNIPRQLRPERDRWRERLQIRLIFEDLPKTSNAVTLDSDDPNIPAATHTGHSEYAQRGLDAVPDMVTELARTLPIERYTTSGRGTEGHIQGTTVMGIDPRSSVVDRDLVHHAVRNLVVLGSGVFPTCPPANPTLTLSALSLWSAAHLLD